MNILIPMAGQGSRFKDVGYRLPKPLIDINGKPMIQRVVENLNINGKYIFVVRQEHCEKYDLPSLLKRIVPNCEIVIADGLTEGQACSALLAKEHIDSAEPLLIVNSDNYFVWDTENFLHMIQNPDVHGTVFTFKDNSKSLNWSYAKVDDDGNVLEVAEKNPISDNALAGAFYWRRGSDFVQCTNEMIEKDIRVNNEFYIAPVFNEAIAKNNNIKNHTISDMKSMGTPDELGSFLDWVHTKKMSLKLDDFILNYNKHMKERKMLNNRKFQTVLEDLRAGKPIILVDEYDRENEGDIVIAAEKCNEENLVFTMNYAKGLMCLPCSGEILDRLELPPMVADNTDRNETPFTVSIDARDGTTTGMSVQDRMTTIGVLLDDDATPVHLTRPGHLFPLRARPGLLKERRGHTEGSIQLMELAGLKPVSMICEIMNNDGTMTKGGDLNKFAVEHGLSIISIEEVYEAAYNESL
jgi:3,4-dihydroxy-2-butanone 4-phosphate synthase|tara:strand:- start:918 stop:2318 length:1401 start_codon:yes stop_codon:yes gene_type:complete